MAEKNYETIQTEEMIALGISTEQSRKLLVGEVAIGARGLIARILHKTGEFPTLIEAGIETVKEKRLTGNEAYQYIQGKLTDYNIRRAQTEIIW
ncbi:hypothetical protein HOD88_00250 [archaeon]|jgi:hypothetical protein|nr:hypothetical protein [archaeon]